MRAVIISDSDARALLDQLEQQALRRDIMRDDPERPPTIENMHRAFHYVVVRWLQGARRTGYTMKCPRCGTAKYEDENCPGCDMPLPKVTPAEHSRRCGPLCMHVQLCDACVNVHGLCEVHRSDPDGSYVWTNSPPPPAAATHKIGDIVTGDEAVRLERQGALLEATSYNDRTKVTNWTIRKLPVAGDAEKPWAERQLDDPEVRAAFIAEADADRAKLLADRDSLRAQLADALAERDAMQSVATQTERERSKMIVPGIQYGAEDRTLRLWWSYENDYLEITAVCAQPPEWFARDRAADITAGGDVLLQHGAFSDSLRDELVKCTERQVSDTLRAQLAEVTAERDRWQATANTAIDQSERAVALLNKVQAHVDVLFKALSTKATP